MFSLAQARHTILLAQFSAADTSRTYYDFESMKGGVERECPLPSPPCPNARAFASA